MNKKLVEEIEKEIAELKSRFPPHSVPGRMWQHLEDLEEKLERVKAAPDNEEPG